MLDTKMESRVDELKRYIRFSAEDAALLAAFAPHAKPHFRRLAEEFYERVREHEDAHDVFTGEAQIRRLQGSMVLWLERVFGGVYDEAYFHKTEQIGRAHVKVGLPQRYMFTAMALMRSSLVALIHERVGDRVAQTADALSRLLDIELAVMLESYRIDLMARVERAYQTRAGLSSRPSEAEGHYVRAVELAPMLVVGLDRKGDVLLFNREAERTTGYARDEVLGRSFVDLFVQEAQRATDARTLLAGATEVDVELPLLTRAGKIRDIRWQVSSAPSPEDGGVARLVIGVDVTEERVELERQQQEKRLAAVGTLAAGLAHEIRNPLNGARLHLAILERALAKTDSLAGAGAGAAEALDAVHVASYEIQRLARLVTDFLDFARPQPLAWGEVDVKKLCARGLQIVASSAPSGVVLQSDVPSSELWLNADEQRLEQVLLNLLQNAVEALGANGNGQVVLRARREPRYVWIEVEDDGPGVPAGPTSIFDAFYSTKPNGTGLGLAIVHRIVTDHGGSVDVQSQPGQTRFRVKLPLTR